MGHLSSIFNGLARSLSLKKGRNSEDRGGRDAAETMAKEAKKNDLILRTSGIVNANGSNNFTSTFSKRGNKGINQDCLIVWEVCKEFWLFSLSFFLCSLYEWQFENVVYLFYFWVVVVQ